MAKQHLKRIAAPHTWNIKRKKHVWITRPNPGAHPLTQCVSLSTAMKEIIKCANTSKEVKTILHTKTVLVDGKQRKDSKLPVGLMDVISFPEIKETYRMLISPKGLIKAIEISGAETSIKPSKIIGKTSIKGGKTQLNLFDSRSIVLEKDNVQYHVGDTLILNLPKQEIKEHYKLEKGVSIFLTAGNHVGQIAKIEDITGNIIACKTEKESFTTAKKYAFVIGKETPIIKVK